MGGRRSKGGVLLVRVFGMDGLDRVGPVKVWSSGGLSMDMTSRLRLYDYHSIFLTDLPCSAIWEEHANEMIF